MLLGDIGLKPCQGTCQQAPATALGLVPDLGGRGLLAGRYAWYLVNVPVLLPCSFEGCLLMSFVALCIADTNAFSLVPWQGYGRCTAWSQYNNEAHTNSHTAACTQECLKAVSFNRCCHVCRLSAQRDPVKSDGQLVSSAVLTSSLAAM